MAFQKVFDFKEVTIEYRSNGAASFQFSTDMPGGALAARLGAGFTLPTSGGIGLNRTQTVPLDGIQGTMYQPQITPGSSTQIIVLSAKLWLRPIGVYLDGTLNEEWITQPIAVGA
jgi:hypothetical protein